MSYSASASASGFRVTADNAVDYLAGHAAGGAAHVGAKIQQMQQVLHMDNQKTMTVIAQKSDEIMAVNQAGFTQVDASVRGGFTSLKNLAGVQVAVQAVGFALVAGQLQGVRRDLRHLAAQGEQLIRLQRIANQQLDQLVNLAQRSLEVHERILDALLTSRTVEAQQLLRQGWENLKHGYEDEALARFEQSLVHDNTVYVVHASLARLYRKRGDKVRAEDHYVRAWKFSSSVNPDVHVLACLEYATFLEDEERVADCIQQLRYALEVTDNPAWRFHLAELLAKTGQPDQSLAELRRAIEGDDELFAASMTSQRLESLGKALIQLLVDLDETRRSSCFGHLEAIAADIERLDAINALHSPGTAELKHQTQALREQAASTFHAFVSATYAELPAPTSRAYEVRGEAARELAAAPSKIAAPLFAWVSSWTRAVRLDASSEAMVSSPATLRTAFGMLCLVLGVPMMLLGLLMGGDEGVGLLVLGGVPTTVGFLMKKAGRSGTQQMQESANATLSAHAASRAAISMLLADSVYAARGLVASWRASVPAPLFVELDGDLARTPLPPPGPVPPPLAAVFEEWRRLAATPFGAVPRFVVSPDGAAYAQLPAALSLGAPGYPPV